MTTPLTSADVTGPAAKSTGTTRRTRPSTSGLAFKLCWLGMLTISFNATRVVDFAISDLFFLAATVTIGLKIVLGETRDLAPAVRRRSSRLVMVGTLILLTMGTLSSIMGPAPRSSMLVMARFAWLTIVWFWTLRAVCRDRQALLGLVSAWRIGLVLSAIAATLGSAGVGMFVTNNNEGRQAAFTFHPGELMNFLIVGLQVAIAAVAVLPATGRISSTTRRNLAIVALLSYALFATGSTSGLIATAVGLLAMVSAASAARLIAGRRKYRVTRKEPGRSPLTIMFGAAVLLAGVALLFNSDLPIRERLDRLRSGDSGVASSLESRERANSEILNDFDGYLVVGLGPNLQHQIGDDPGQTVINVHGDLQNGVHNMWLKMVYEEGLIALLGLWLILAAVIRQGYRLVLSTRGTDLYPLAIGLFGGVFAANVSSMFGPTAFSRHFWLPIALIGCLWEVRRGELEAGRVAESDAAPATSDASSVPATGSFSLDPPLPGRP